MKEKKKIKAISDIVLCIAICSSFLLFFAIFFRGQKIYSSVENRDLQLYEKFTISSFTNGQYQTKVESFLSDQLLLSGTIKRMYTEKNAIVNSYFIDKYALPLVDENNSITKYKYIKIKDNVYKFTSKEHFFDKFKDYDSYIQYVEKNLNKMNIALNKVNIPKYMYYISSSRSANLTVENGEIFYNYIKDNLKVDKISKLNIQNYDDYKKYFYKTDHHWNNVGQYKGYIDIQKLLGNSEIIKPKSEITYDVDYYGSYARTTLDYSTKEKFKVYKYDLKKYSTIIEGKNERYGNPKSYDNKTYSKQRLENRYRSYYGGDYAEIIYDFNNSKKENLMVIATSYSNAINNLIASNYNKTFVIDLRHIYSYNKKFNLKDYVKENKIDKILLLGDIYFFGNEENGIRG